jgi:hypothetical protein
MRCCDQCRPLNSARMFENPAPIFQKRVVRSLLAQKEGCNVVEIGAGCLRNALFLLKTGLKVSVLEVPGMEARFPEKFAKFRRQGGILIPCLPKKKSFELAVATFVLETICDKTLRVKIASELCASLEDSGCLIISVRGPSDLVTATQKGTRCSDGYLTPGYTFARSFTRGQLERLLTRAGFRKIDFFHRKRIDSPELVHALAWRQ